MEHLTFSNGKTIPVLGFGTWNAPPNVVGSAVQHALKVGYRHLDCAYVYSNEKEIGEAIDTALEELKLKREDIFITSKCWCTYFQPDRVRKCCERSLKDLKVSYLDLYLIHWPVALKPGDENFPKDENGEILLDNTPLLDTWRAMEDLVDAGLVKSIGLSNFNKRQIDLILDNCRTKPVNLQIEIHANFPNTALVEYAQSKGLTVTAYAPLGSPGSSPGRTDLRDQPWVVEIAKRHNKTTTQVLLRYLVQRNLAIVPKSVTPSHIDENGKIFDFVLSEDEMNTLHTSGLNERQFWLLGFKASPEYPFNDKY